MKKRLSILVLILLVVATSGFGCKTVSQDVQQKMQPITLNYWRVWDGPDDFDQIIKNYNAQHSFITINYRKLSYDEYEQALLDALAEDRGPDIFSIQNTWVKKYQTKISPMPDSISMVYPVVQGTLKKEIVPELRTTKSITPADVKDSFVDTVYTDVVLNDTNDNNKPKIYGLPLSIDTLAMYYNKDLLNNAGIAQLPAYWNKEFQQDVKKLTKQDLKGDLIQSGVGLGGSSNIERSSDIMAALMMQNGAIMMDGNSVSFNTIPPIFQERGYNPGMEAARFYSDFANPSKEVYSWNDQLDNSLKHFTDGKLAIFFGYSYHLPVIQAQAPKLNFGIAKFPQIEGNTNEANVANYWVETVSNKSKYKNEAWDFIQFMTTQQDQVKTYLDKTKHPTALRSLIADQLNDDDLKVFASQLLIAKSWYHGKDFISADKAINEMIDAIIANPEHLEDAVNVAAGRVQQTVGQ
jgi:multiple sugar transport system substrate-binding protein